MDVYDSLTQQSSDTHVFIFYFYLKSVMETNDLSATRCEISFGAFGFFFFCEGPRCLNTVSLSFISDVTG